jgi:proteic killer suppression protein
LILIVSFRHKGLRKFFETGSLAGIQPHQASRLQYLLTALDASDTIEDMDQPGFYLHLWKGIKPPRWAIKINENWRLTFEFEKGDACLIDYEDYH